MDYHQSSAPRLASTIDECMAEGKHANLLSYLSVGTMVVGDGGEGGDDGNEVVGVGCCGNEPTDLSASRVGRFSTCSMLIDKQLFDITYCICQLGRGWWGGDGGG